MSTFDNHAILHTVNLESNLQHYQKTRLHYHFYNSLCYRIYNLALRAHDKETMDKLELIDKLRNYKHSKAKELNDILKDNTVNNLTFDAKYNMNYTTCHSTVVTFRNVFKKVFPNYNETGDIRKKVLYSLNIFIEDIKTNKYRYVGKIHYKEYQNNYNKMRDYNIDLY